MKNINKGRRIPEVLVNNRNTGSPDFLTWLEETKTQLREVRDREILSIKARNFDLAYDDAVKHAAIEREIHKFVFLCDSKPGKNQSEIADPETLAAYEANLAEMERLASEFETKWGEQYDKYCGELQNVIDATEAAIEQLTVESHSNQETRTPVKTREGEANA